MSNGQTVASRYQLESLLGSGGFAEVWRATDTRTGEEVAVKLPRAGRENEANERLRDEAAILTALRHPNIVRILDSGTDGGRAFLAMELLDGPSLRDVIRGTGPMGDDSLVGLGVALAGALAAAHAQGFVHGDVKPENVIIASGVPYLIDFGTARNLRETLGPEELREVAGTLAYLAPELLTGEPLSAQSDVYALGVTLYEARSGRLPFAGGGGALAGSEGRNASPLSAHATGVDPRVESAIMQSLSIDPAWRPATAGEVRERLKTGRHDTVVLRPQRSSAGAAFAGGTAVGAAAATVAREPHSAPEPRQEAFRDIDAWLNSGEDEPGLPGRLVALMALAAVVVAAAFLATTLLRGGSSDPEPAGEDDPAGTEADVEASSTPEPTQTPAPETSTPSATATATAPPPTATPAPPTATPVPPTPPPLPSSGQVIQPQLDAQSGAGRVLRWYELVVAGRYDEAYALWSERMKANFPRQGNLDDRWANTVSVSVNDVQVVSETGNRMTVAIDFLETLADGSSRRFVGNWHLVASESGWLLDAPSF